MAVLTDKQFYVLAGAAVVGTYIAYTLIKKAVNTTVEVVSETVNDSVEYAEKVGEATEYLGGYYLDGAIDWMNDFWQDEFDKKHKNPNMLMTESQYQRWKEKVQAGELPEPRSYKEY